MPVRIQLDHNSSLRHNLVEQVRVELRKELERGRYHARRGPETKESLWAYFHQPELEIRDREMGDRVVNVVLVFDQFEEIFSRSQGDPSHEWAQRALIEELAQLIDNCVPPDLKRELESDPATVRRYDFDDHDYRIDLPDEVTETFKDRIRYDEEFWEILSTARLQPTRAARREALLKIQRNLGDLNTVLQSVLIELMTSFRDAEAFEELIALYNAFPDSLKDYVVAKQQFALALNRRNRRGDRKKALKILDDLLKNRGADSETLGVKGRIHKDIYKEAAKAEKITAIAALEDAITAYTKGFEADPRDYYPGVNAINLLIQKGDAQALKEVERLLPLVSFAVARRGGASSSDYWDLATVLELACMGEDWATANRILPKVILAATDSFKTATTLGNLRLLKQAREREGRDLTELDGILNQLSARDIELRGEEKLNPA